MYQFLSSFIDFILQTCDTRLRGMNTLTGEAILSFKFVYLPSEKGSNSERKEYDSKQTGSHKKCLLCID